MKIKALLLAGAIALFMSFAPRVGAAWQPVTNSLMTQWAADVSPETTHQEYPRPQLVREQWLNLNGLWDYAITSLEADRPESFDGQILVPFPIESSLSGVKRRLDEHSLLWYRRSVDIPAGWAGQRILLHFEAVDWRATVFVNGKQIGVHRGGYDGFTMDITAALRARGPQELAVAVFDPTEGDQPRGKQSRKPEGIFYTPASGIWQTVWLEPVPEIHIDELTLTPDVDSRSLRLRAAVGALAGDCQIEAVALEGGREAGRVSGSVNADLVLPVRSPRLWSPKDPFLYDLRVTVKRGGQSVDSVASYFAFRKISVGKDVHGVNRILLNDEPAFLVGVLDQGFWPDGNYTAPTDKALRSDIDTAMRLGFNLIRKHVKVEPERWYYWCDKLGMLVWQDMPSGNNGSEDSRRQFEIELRRLLEGRANHPSIIMWTLFNEGWGQYDTERLARWMKEVDPTRLVDNASGWTDRGVGDVIDMHNYPGPGAPAPDRSRALVLGEFGGLELAVPDHTWSKQDWGYLRMSDASDLTAQYTRLLSRAWLLRDVAGLSAVVYTQITDIETECNGLLTYDRAVIKVDQTRLAQANRGELTAAPVNMIVTDALQGPVRWRYVTIQPPADWFKSEFDDSAWGEGLGGFGTPQTPEAIVGTEWKTGDIWIRRKFTIDKIPSPPPKLHMHHDEDAEVYINGVLAVSVPGFTISYQEFDIAPAALATLQAGTNTLAIHCHQTTGGQFIDAGLLRPLHPLPDDPK
jgi:hypothetical protein